MSQEQSFQTSVSMDEYLSDLTICNKRKLHYAEPDQVKEKFLLNELDMSYEHVIALMQVGTHRYCATVNPFGKPGGRIILSLYKPGGPEAMATTLNRKYTMQETLGHKITWDAMEHAMSKFNVIVQASQAGNKAQWQDPETGFVWIGKSHQADKEKGLKASEGSKLHVHLCMRHDPNTELIPGMKLGGPPIGDEFLLMVQKGTWPKDHSEKKDLSKSMIEYACFLGKALSGTVEQYNKENNLPDHLQIKLLGYRDWSNVNHIVHSFV